ncbi:MAG: alpha-mannosidase [Clostridiales bacterium]|nr:MAG: alpha-mannosidase [Clostridiales bacterium]
MKKVDDLHYKDLYFRENRIKHYVELLKSLRYPKTEALIGWKHALGDFEGPQQPDYDDSGWADFGELSRFGSADEYGWFRRTVVIPDSFAGLRVALNVKSTLDGDDDPFSRWNETNPGFICYIDGALAGHYDRFHKSILLTESARGGEVYRVALKYWTENPKTDYFCPILRAIDPLTETLYYDFRLPYEQALLLNQQDGGKMQIIAPLSEAATMLDLREPYSPAYFESLDRAHRYLWDNFYNGKWAEAAPDAAVRCIGHAHIDVAWMWRIRQTHEKTLRTFLNALHYIDTDPDFTFISSQAVLYSFIKEDYPEVYERIKAAVKAGRWEVDGGMWVEADCNLTSGEGFVRQFLYGTRFFRDEFGAECKMLWLPDVFGYSASLPQILRQFGLSYFTTAKINNNEYNCMPHDTFVWQGIDGSEVFTHLITGARLPSVRNGEFSTAYNTELAPSFLNGAWEHYHDKELTDEVFLPIGWGDGGGGAADYMIEFGKRMKNGLPGSVRAEWGFVGDWFDKWSERLRDNRFLPKWIGELYFELHRGTLTSMARIKRKNRKSELLYQKAEWISTLNALLAGGAYPKAQLDEGWKLVLTNQFHDILPGSSIKPVYDDADRDYARAFELGAACSEPAEAALAEAVSGGCGDIVVFNPTGFSRTDIVFADTSAASAAGTPSQRTADGRLCFVAEVPAKGYAVFRPSETACGGTTASFDGTVLESGLYRITLDSDGFFASLYDKTNRREVLLPGQRGNLLRAYEDLPLSNDAWDINVFYREKYEDVTELVSCELVENGAVYAVLRQVRRFHQSTLTQDIVLYAGSPRIDFRTVADWKEKHILLKAHFPVDVNATKATYEIQFGALERNTHENTPWDFAKFEVCGHKWADLSDNGYGLSLLNDCKYGYSARGTDLALSLIKCATGPNVDADRERHEFTYALLPHAGSLRAADTVRQGYLLNCPLEARVQQADGGALAPRFSLVCDEAESGVVIDTVKRAEDSGETVVRLYEPLGGRRAAALRFGLPVRGVCRTNLAETDDQPLALAADGSLPLTLSAFEIVTLKVAFEGMGE